MHERPSEKWRPLDEGAKFDSGRPLASKATTIAAAFVPSLGDSICRLGVDFQRVSRRWSPKRAARVHPLGLSSARP